MRSAALVLTIGSLLAAGAAPARADDAARPVVSSRTAPAIPLEGSPVDLIASSPGLGVSYSWDLDGDGAFADAAGATARQTLPAGTRTVSVRATDTFGRTSTETRSVTVATANYPPVISLSTRQRTQVDRLEGVAALAWDEDGKVVKIELDLDGDGAYEVSDPGRNDWRKEWVLFTDVTYATPGDRIVRARVTDDRGATAVATSTVHVVDPPPSAWLHAYGDSFDRAPVAGQPATIAADSMRPGVKYEFDLDGDGRYELDQGRTPELKPTLTAGAHVIGARITDRAGTVLEPRITTFAYQPEDAFADKLFVRRFESHATVGEPMDLAVNVEPYTYVYTVEWDADGDGEFDDGTFTTPGGQGSGSSIGHNTYTYTAPGVYEQRVRVSRAGLPTRIFSARTFVDTRTVDRTPIFSLDPVFGVPFAELYRIEAVLPSDALVNATLSWDLDGDGEFDETPQRQDSGYLWTFTAPTTIAVKATDVSGASSVLTTQLQPPGANRTPAATLGVSAVAGGPLLASYAIDDAAGAPRCCDAAWDSDGDGAYDDGQGVFPAVTATQGEHTVGLRLTDSLSRSVFVRKTFTVGTRPPEVGFHVEGPWLAGGAADPDGKKVSKFEWDLDGDGAFDDDTGIEARAPVGTHRIGLKATDADGDIGVAFREVMAGEPLKLKVRIASTRLRALLRRGLVVRPGCSKACRATVVVSAAGKARASRAKPHRELGRRTGKGRKIRVKLNHNARRSLRKAHSVKLVVAVRATARGNRGGKARRALKIRR
jgi:hypothetical protein